MKKYIILPIVCIFLFCAVSAQAKRADLAGFWYKNSPEDLRKEIEGYLEKARVPRIEGEVIGIIVPHAGLEYSGPVAAYGYKALEKDAPELAVLVGFTHRRHFPDSIAILTDDSFITPLGPARIDKDVTEEFLKYSPQIKRIPKAFISENSVEMEIPLIQVALKDARLVVMAISDQKIEVAKLLARALRDVLKGKKSYVMIASTDLCHFLEYKKAREKDADTIKAIEAFKPDDLYAKSVRQKHDMMCGPGAVYAVMKACQYLGADEVKVLKYANSGDTSRKKDNVVGYMSAVFIRPNTVSDKPVAAKTNTERRTTNDDKEEAMLNSDQQQKLLKIARDTINHYFKTGKPLEVNVEDEVLNENMGAFVTLHNKGRLRGCIGHMEGRQPLCLTVRDMSVAAATQDPRFRFDPVTLDEMKEIDIEISVLSPMEKIEDPDIIVPGRHGVKVEMGWKGGVYLPQVATEQGWDRDTFMNSLCGEKAGIPMDAWKTGECDIYVFTAEVFGEKEK